MSKNTKKLLTDTYVSDRVNINEEEARKQITESEFEIKSILYDKSEDKDLNAARSILKDLNAGYSSVISIEKAKIDFLLGKIEENRLLNKILQ